MKVTRNSLPKYIVFDKHLRFEIIIIIDLFIFKQVEMAICTLYRQGEVHSL